MCGAAKVVCALRPGALVGRVRVGMLGIIFFLGGAKSEGIFWG